GPGRPCGRGRRRCRRRAPRPRSRGIRVAPPGPRDSPPPGASTRRSRRTHPSDRSPSSSPITDATTSVSTPHTGSCSTSQGGIRRPPARPASAPAIPPYPIGGRKPPVPGPAPVAVGPPAGTATDPPACAGGVGGLGGRTSRPPIRGIALAPRPPPDGGLAPGPGDGGSPGPGDGDDGDGDGDGDGDEVDEDGPRRRLAKPRRTPRKRPPSAA